MSNQRNLFIYGCSGCLAFVFLIVILLVTGIGFLGYQGYRFGKGISDVYQEMVQEYARIDSQFSYTPPETNLMEADRVDHFLSVRSHLTEIAKTHFTRFDQLGTEIESQFSQPGIFAKIRGVGKIKDIISHAVTLGADIGKAHIQLLEENAMSAKEYRWITAHYLGTIAKADESLLEEGPRIWKEYLANFEEWCKKHKEISFDMGDRKIRSKDINRDHLFEKISLIEFQRENVEIVNQTISQFIYPEETTILDFLALHLDSILTELSKEM